MLEYGIIKPSQNEWASPCVLVDKPDGTTRFCTDYRWVNAITKVDYHPIPRMEDCIERIGKAQYIIKCDLLKGYWAVPLTERAKRISAFGTPEGAYQYRVIPSGMRNSQATFVRLMNKCQGGISGVDAYIDDVIYIDTWEEHIKNIERLFQRLKSAKLVIGKAEVKYLGHIVEYGKITPTEAKTRDILKHPTLKNIRGLRRFLGMAGY